MLLCEAVPRDIVLCNEVRRLQNRREYGFHVPVHVEKSAFYIDYLSNFAPLQP